MTSVCTIKLNNECNVYNFEVEDYHTYYVGSLRILVHNKCALDAKYYSTRRSAFRDAKRDAGIPVSSQPTAVQPNYNKHKVILPGRQYVYGKKIIREDIFGHIFEDGTKLGPHFNYGKRHYFWRVNR